MKLKLIFVLKTIFASTLASMLLHAIVFHIQSIFRGGSHPHQIWPDWLVGAVSGGFVTLVLSLVVSLVFLYMQKLNVLKASIWAVAISLVSVFIFWYLPLL